jgi:hypothetical protein
MREWQGPCFEIQTKLLLLFEKHGTAPSCMREWGLGLTLTVAQSYACVYIVSGWSIGL